MEHQKPARTSLEAVPSHEDAWDTARAAAFLGLSENTIRKYTFLRLLPHYKLGARVVYIESELAAYRAKGRVPTLNDQKARP